MLDKRHLDHAAFDYERDTSVRDPIHRIRLELDPTVGPSEMKRPSDLLRLGSGIPAQYQLYDDSVKPLEFVVKRHHATNLHTDFRLEAFGTLLSWAFWEQPSLDPGKVIKAREVGDHQAKYMRSERRIPDGSYGAGPMIVWDRGKYRPLVRTETTDEQTVVSSLQTGRLDFWLEGERLKGGFRLELGRKRWLFTKLDDEHANAQAEPIEDRSIESERTLEDVELEYQRRSSLRRR